MSPAIRTTLQFRKSCSDATAQLSVSALEFHLNANSSLMRLHRGAKLTVIIEINPHGIGQAERRGCAGIGAILAFADALHRDALGTEADDDRTEILRHV